MAVSMDGWTYSVGVGELKKGRNATGNNILKIKLLKQQQMKQVQHTQGEWYAQNTAGDHDIAIYTGKDIALVRGTDEEAQANALLIKNAPRMLRALQSMLNYLNEDLYHYEDVNDKDAADSVRRTRNRIEGVIYDATHLEVEEA
jgi:hypothetical protein